VDRQTFETAFIRSTLESRPKNLNQVFVMFYKVLSENGMDAILQPFTCWTTSALPFYWPIQQCIQYDITQITHLQIKMMLFTTRCQYNARLNQFIFTVYNQYTYTLHIHFRQRRMSNS